MRRKPLDRIYAELGKQRAVQEQLRTIESGGGGSSFTYGDYVALLARLPMCRGVWAMSNVDASGNAYDASNLGKTLTYHGDSTYRYVDSIYPYFIPVISFDGTGDYLSRVSEADNQITGAETYVASELNGLTILTWVFPGAFGSDQSYIGKWNTTGNQRAYLLNITSGDNPQFQISSDGTATDSITSSVTLSSGVPFFYNFICGRFEPSNEVAIWVNAVKDTNTSGIASSIFSTSTAELQLGARNAGTSLLTGDLSVSALYAGLIQDDVIDNIYTLGRTLFYL